MHGPRPLRVQGTCNAPPLHYVQASKAGTLNQPRPKTPESVLPTADSLNIQTLQVKQRLEELQRTEGTSDVVVVGGGYAGIELASVAAEMLAGEWRTKFPHHYTVRGVDGMCVV